jgi:hypothetical protein
LTKKELFLHSTFTQFTKQKEFPLMIPSSAIFDQSIMQCLLDNDPVIQEYRAFFSLFDWSLVEQWKARQSLRGRPAHPECAYIQSFLIRIREGMIYTSQLRSFLLKHPLLVVELGFHLHLDSTAPYGFDAGKTVPSNVRLRKKLRSFDQTLLQDLLHGTVRDLQDEIPGLGETVAFDVKHLYAWVRENNERAYVKDRYDKTRRPDGDPDCRLGVKRSTNIEQPDGSTKEKKELLWGYGSGVAAATTPDYGDVVLAEYTQSFNEGDVTYFLPLHRQTVVALQRFPTHVTADAAFDAWYVYESALRHGGIGAVPLNQHTGVLRDADATPRCEQKLRMVPTIQFNHTYGYRAQRFRCPLLFPHKTDATCTHEQFAKGKGCVKDVNWERGGKMRVTLDRTSPLYQAIYRQRTSCERINSQAKELGIERPKVRNRRSVENLNTLIYLVINVRALERAKSINKGLLVMN